MRPIRYVLSRQAEQALDDIWLYYFGQGGSSLASRIVTDIERAVERLVLQPWLGHERTDLTDAPVRFYLVHRFFIIYDPASSPLHIVRIEHSARDISTRLDEDRP